jgi:hypothetical protein
MIHRTWAYIRGSVRRPRHAQEGRRRHSTGGASRDAGRAPARTLRLLVGPPHLVVVCLGAQPDRDCRGPFVLVLQRVPHGTSLSEGDPGAGVQCPRPTGSACAHAVLLPTLRRSLPALLKAAPRAPWLVPHALELRYAGPDAGSQARDQGLGRDDAPLGARGRLGVEAGETGRERR